MVITVMPRPALSALTISMVSCWKRISRLLVGGDHRVLFPVSALLGGCLLILADLVGRTVASPVVIPVGIVVSFIGVPVFVYLILRDRKERVL